jgi:ERCC4-type nuclease
MTDVDFIENFIEPDRDYKIGDYSTEEENAPINKSGIYILVDDRERAVYSFFDRGDVTTINIPYEITRLTVGDYVIMYGDVILAIIERKTWKDLASSLLDGRKKNTNKMITVRDEENCKLIYLIEGNASPNPNSKVQRVPYKNLISHLDHLSFRDNIIVVYSKSRQDTPLRITTYAKNISTLAEFASHPKSGGGELSVKRKFTKSDLTIKVGVLSKIKGVSEKTAELLVENNITVADLAGGCKIVDFKYSSGKSIGSARSKKILNSVGAKSTQINILSGIPSISKSSARFILSTTSMIELINLSRSYPDDNSLQNLKKTEKAKIGKNGAKNIAKFLIT